MRTRVIRPGFFDDFALGRLPHGARLLFIGLWCAADREGRILDIPRRIAAEIYPHDSEGIEADVAKWLAMLDCAGVILRYESEGQKCIHIKNFALFQKCHPNEAESRLPPPPTIGTPKVNQRLTKGTPLVSPKANQCHTKGEPLVPPKVDQCQRTSTSTSTSSSTSSSKAAAAKVSTDLELEDIAAAQAPPPPQNGTHGYPPEAVAAVSQWLQDAMEHWGADVGPPDRALVLRILQIANGADLADLHQHVLELAMRRKTAPNGYGFFVRVVEDKYAH